MTAIVDEWKPPRQKFLTPVEYLYVGLFTLAGVAVSALLGGLCGLVLRNSPPFYTGILVLGAPSLFAMVFVFGHFVEDQKKRWVWTFLVPVAAALVGSAFGLLFNQASPVVFGAILAAVVGLVFIAITVAFTIVVAIASEVEESTDHFGV